MTRKHTPDEELNQAVKAYYEHSGNKSEAARSLGLHRTTYNDRLTAAQSRLGIKLGKVADGRVKAGGPRRLPLPRKGHRAFYLLTSIQNNTHLHPGFENVLAYARWLDGLDRTSARLMIGTYSYQLATYGPKAVKRGRHKGGHEELWYAPEAEPYIADDDLQLAPGLVWAGKQNILPTSRWPLSQLEQYNGRSSNVVPHAKIAMESVASMADEATKFNYTTGTVTQRNYIQKKAGILGEQEHRYGFALACLDSDGNWYVRQVEMADDGSFQDVGPEGYRGVSVTGGRVYHEAVTASIYWGDGHAAEMEMWVRELAWGKGGMLDVLRARHQFVGDVFSMRSRGHHEMRDFHRSYQKHVDGEETVEDELRVTSDLLAEMSRTWCETTVVPSNHHRHLYRWLNEADYRLDPVNAKLFLELQWQVLDAADRGYKGFDVLEWALRKYGAPEATRFLALDESFIVAGIENGLHGDLGPNGARGSTRSLMKLGRPVNKGHDHVAAIYGSVYSAGACSLSFPYMKGPNSHSVTHIVTYLNGKRALVTMWGGRWRV